ncbi:DUF3231 family protein [Bacillus sp. 1P10SD]|uniref:DUF3231 family protein n=1 Tax=Bacillus sp. 1P10SD TaxID=3132265 RepID=UPI0039A73C9F
MLIGAEGTKTPAGVRGRGDPAGAKRRGGSPACPRKAKCLERKSTSKFNTANLLKHIKVFSSYLEMDSLPAPMSYDQEVTESIESPFSDKLMMFHFNLMIYVGIGNYGVSIAESQRSDMVIDYSRLNAEILKYSEDGANIMIANGWLEQPPIAANRRDLAKE